MYIKEIQIKNFKSFKKANLKLNIPDGKTSGSGLNIFIGENNAGKSSIFEILRKPILKLVDKEEINYSAQNKKEEVLISIINHIDQKISFESRYFASEDPDNKIYFTEQGFDLNLYHSNTSRKLEKNTSYGNLPHTVHHSKQEDAEAKSDNYKIIQEIHKLSTDEKNEFCKVVNEFLPEIKRVFVKSDRRADRAVLACKLKDGTEIDLRDMGSGIEQFIILLWVIKFGTIKILIIDEPEISLHPKAQLRLSELLLDNATNRQIIIATHSPYIFKNCVAQNCRLYIFNKTSNITSIIDFKNPKIKKLFPWSPSWGEINFKGYNLSTVEFHNELYGYLQEREKKYSEKNFELYLTSKGVKQIKNYIFLSRGSPCKPYKMSLPTYIRNQIHHPENNYNKRFTDSELMRSIQQLVKLI